MADFVSSNLSEDQLLPVAGTLLPVLLRILGEENVSPRVVCYVS